MIYFDNAATTFPKPKSVIKEVTRCLRSYCGNPGRSAHVMSLRASEKIYEAREAVAGLIGLEKSENVVFTQNASYALNLAIKTSVMPGDKILISDLEHNSVLRVVDKLSCEDADISYSVFSSDSSEKELEDIIKNGISLVVCNAISNVTGKENPIKAISNLRQKYKFKFIVDASQMLGHKEFSYLSCPCDVVCAPGHKALFGIQGSGFCAFYNDVSRGSLIEGGSGNESKNRKMPTQLPERLEAGTLSTPAIASLLPGIEFIKEQGIENIENHLSCLTDLTRERLSELKDVKIYGAENGLVSFGAKKLPPSRIAALLDRCGICVRAGFHCAPLTHEMLGTYDIGTVRVSFSFFNSKKEIDLFYRKLSEILFLN